MKILHLGDLHLGKRVNEISMIEDQKFILDQIVTLVKEEKIDVILLCGDIYDKAIPTIEAIHLLDEFLEELSDLKVKVLMISGNHDSSERLSFGRNLFKRSNLYIASQFNQEIEKITIKEDGYNINFYMLPFVKPAYINHVLKIQTETYEECFKHLMEQVKIKEDETNILLAHQFVTVGKNSPELSDSETSSLGGIDNIDYRLFDAFDYVALGHIHKPQMLVENRMAYAGSLEPTDVGDTGAHGYIEGKITGNGCQIRFVPHALREYRHCEVQVDKSVTGHVLRQKIADMIEEQGKQNMYKITLTGYRDPDIWYELDHMDPYGNVVEITDHTKPAYDFEKLKNENKGNILGQYIESLSGYPADSLEYQALCEGVQALMETRRG